MGDLRPSRPPGDRRARPQTSRPRISAPPRPGRPSGAPVSAGRAAALRGVQRVSGVRPGPTTSPPTGAATATPARPASILAGRRTCTSVRIRSCPAWLPWPSCTRVMTTLCGAERRAAPRVGGAHSGRGPDRQPAGCRRHAHLRPSHASSADGQQGRYRRQRRLTSSVTRREKGGRASRQSTRCGRRSAPGEDHLCMPRNGRSWGILVSEGLEHTCTGDFPD